jgi:DivIVA domain-containing protein
MATVFLVLVVVLVIAGLVFGVISLLSGDDPGLSAVDPDGRARPLPNNRSLSEFDLKDVRFDTGLRGYRMSQVDRVLRRTAYDLGYKDEMIAVLEAEVIALREGRSEDAELLRKARESAAGPPPSHADLSRPTDDRTPASAVDEEPADEVEDFTPSRGTAATGSTAAAGEVDSDPAPTDADHAAHDREPGNLPREGSLRRREASTDSTAEGSTTDDSASDDRASDDSASDDRASDNGASDNRAPDHSASDDSATNPADRPAPHA